MARVLNSISFGAPAAPVSASVSDTFAFTGTPGFTGSGGVQRYDWKWEVDDGGGYVTIASSGTGLTTSGTNPLVNTNSSTANSITVSCDAPGSYTIRMAGAPTSGGSYTVFSSTQSVTVTQEHTATGAITGQATTVAGTGSHVPNPAGTGAITGQATTVVGTGSHVENPAGTGAITLAATTVAGTGAEVFTATGASTLAATTVAGTGDHSAGVPPEGTGAITLAATTVAGTGTHLVNPTGTGAITGQATTVAGTGELVLTATGAIAGAGVTVAGSGVEVFTATGAMALATATVSGTGLLIINPTGTGAIALGTVLVAGVGHHPSPETSGGSSRRLMQYDQRAARIAALAREDEEYLGVLE
ncbi:MAG: hypothetical protein ACO3HN_06395 [Opitutales bacterium]